jgi:hypothetical protein
MGVAVGVYKVCCASRFLPCGNPSLDYVGLMCVEVTGLVLVSKYMAQSNLEAPGRQTLLTAQLQWRKQQMERCKDVLRSQRSGASMHC